MAEFRHVPIVDYIERFFKLPNGKLMKLEPYQKRILELVFTPDENGKLPYRLCLYSTIKKSGKSTLAAAITSWFAFSGIAEPDSEIMVIANDYDQAKRRVYSMLRKSVESHRQLKDACREINLSHVVTKSGAEILPVANDFAGVAGANQELTVWDEIWALRSQESQRLWEELTPVLTRRNSLRLVVTYAGFFGESHILYGLYENLVLQGERVMDDLPVYVHGDAIAFWDSGPEARRMPWQKGPEADKYYRDERKRLSLAGYKRLHLNEWASGEQGLNMTQWDSCVDKKYRIPKPDKRILLAIAIDASYKRDRTAVVSVFKKENQIWLGPREVWQPQEGREHDLETTVEKFVLDLNKLYTVALVVYDPYQMVRSASELRKKGIYNIMEMKQTEPSKGFMGLALLDALRYQRLVLPKDNDLRDEALMVSIKEHPRYGPMIVKDKKTQKIDSVVALAMALVASERLPDMDTVVNQVMVLH